MKNLFSLLLFIFNICYAQVPQQLFVSLNKTVHVFFPSEITYTDVGSKDVLFENKGLILKLAAAVNDFQETNVTVITKDNYCYSFIINYKPDITQLNYFIDISSGKKINFNSIYISKDSLSSEKQKSIEKYDSLDFFCEKSLKKAFSWWDEGAYYKKVYLSLNNIYVYQDKLFFVVSLGNFSNIDYDIDYLKLIVTDKKKPKRSSIQDIEKFPVYSFQMPGKITGQTSVKSFVIVFEKFTIPYGRKIVFEMGEKNGGRSIHYALRKDLIINAISLN